MKIEENERLAALLTAHEMGHFRKLDQTLDPKLWRKVYQSTLHEFMELEKAEFEAQK